MHPCKASYQVHIPEFCRDKGCVEHPVVGYNMNNGLIIFLQPNKIETITHSDQDSIAFMISSRRCSASAGEIEKSLMRW